MFPYEKNQTREYSWEVCLSLYEKLAQPVEYLLTNRLELELLFNSLLFENFEIQYY